MIKIIERTVLSSLMFLFVQFNAHAENKTLNSDLWQSVAKSDAIVSGDLMIDLQSMETMTGSYIEGEIIVRSIEDGILKGPKVNRVRFRYFNENTNYNSVDRVRAKQLTGKKVLAFLVLVDGNYYFVRQNDFALQPYSSSIAEDISIELERQKKIIANWQTNRQLPHFDDVREILELVFDDGAQQQAFKDLEDLGEPAVPAIIAHLGDRRQLPVSSLSLKNHAMDAFEGYRHYGPDVIDDALTAILNQITGEHFGAIYNGATDIERDRTINGWKIYAMSADKFAKNRPSLFPPRN